MSFCYIASPFSNAETGKFEWKIVLKNTISCCPFGSQGGGLATVKEDDEKMNIA